MTPLLMTPPFSARMPTRRLLALALATGLASLHAVPTLAQSSSTAAATDFTVADIRVDGLQRIGAGTVFTYLPIERGDRVDSARIGEAMRALYKTGFFEDIRIDRDGADPNNAILVISVTERPAINTLTLTGNKDIKSEDLLKNLKDIGIAEGETFDRLALDKVTLELNRAYNNRGKYNVQITPTVSRLDRNRVDVTIKVNEGKAARIRHINLTGNDTFEEDDIRERWESNESNWLSWYRRDDQYSREKLSGDLEKLNNFYLDRGYIDFSVDSTQVAISPDKKDMYITAGLTEGEVYTVSGVKISGDTVLSQEQLQKYVLVKEGQTFSRAFLEFTSDSIVAALGNVGYAFARVNPVPDVDREKRTVAINLQVIPGPRVSVRRILFKGNTRTTDEALRREMRQFEGAWYSQAAIDRSKVRLQRLGFFESGSVEAETVPVAGSDDQVDVVFNVKETTSGSFTFGFGYSQLSGLTTTLQLSQNNFLGTGNQLSAEVQRNVYLQRYSFSFLNPYFTEDGLSLGYNLWWREFDNSDFNTAQYSTTSAAFQTVLGLPITENDTVSLVFGIDRNKILASSFIGSPQSLVDYIDGVGRATFHSWRAEVGWARDTRNDFFTPTAGTYQRVSAEITLPGSTAEYYKLNYEYSKYWPLSRALVLNTRFQLGYGDSYGSDFVRDVCFGATPESNPCTPSSPDYRRTIRASGLPIFENFYAGGTRSVRGFRDNTLGPTDFAAGSLFAQPIGGSVKTVGSLEMYFPTLLDTPAARISAFVDVGNVYKDIDSFDANELRATAGVALLWRAPVGPISISYATPIKKEDTDEIERLQFTFGGAF
ncbi:MAG: outer membrane protein assembly factor BamA [Lysobacter sp.]|nr:MAG: outer membrane protein assembly factor BamA [Lysobacter sp.]